LVTGLVCMIGAPMLPAARATSPVFNAAEVAPFFEAMVARRVSIDSVGDSNHHGVLQSGNPARGYYEALGEVLVNRGFTWYGPAGQSCGRGTKMAFGAAPTKGVQEATAAELPVGLQMLMDDTSKATALRSTLADPFGGAGPSRGIEVMRPGFFDVGASYTATGLFGGYPLGQGGGDFSFAIYEDTSGPVVASSPLISNEVGAWTVVSPAPVTGVLATGVHSLRVGHSASTPDHVAFYMGMSRDDLTEGFTLSTFWAEGGAGVSTQGGTGQSWTDFMTGVSTSALELYLRSLVEHQIDTHKLLMLNVPLGMNDRTTDPAVWEADLTTCLSTYESAFDSMLASQGWTGELYVLLWPGPHERLVDGAYIFDLRDRARAVAGSRVRTAVIDTGLLGVNPTWLMNEPGLSFTGTASAAHLRNEGYYAVTWIGIEALLDVIGLDCLDVPGGACPNTVPPVACNVDIDNDGAETIEDLYAAHQIGADHNCDSSLDALDQASVARALRAAEWGDVSAAR
jgi:hypothetical protein